MILVRLPTLNASFVQRGLEKRQATRLRWVLIAQRRHLTFLQIQLTDRIFDILLLVSLASHGILFLHLFLFSLSSLVWLTLNAATFGVYL